MYILNIETATKNCSVAIAKNGVTVQKKDFASEGFSHAELLHVFIEEVVNKSGIEFKDLHAIAVSQGPGSYTGLRIGISAAKGLCFALDIPLIAIDTLTILASQADISDGIIIPMIDARRMEVYSAIFDESLNLIRNVEAEIINEESYGTINQKIYIVGDCQEKVNAVLMDKKFNFLKSIIYPSANEMASLSYEKFINSKFEDLAYFEPFYLKDFIIQSPKS